MMYIGYYKSPIGYVRIETTDDRILSIDFADEEMAYNGKNHQHPVLDMAVTQLDEYFSGKRKEFTLPLEVSGTVFQKKVLEHVKNIPFGQTNSYKEIAEKAGNGKAVRAVGNANRTNKLLIVIPCHRVIGTNQKLTGYAAGLWRKEWLLQHENTIGEK